MTRNSIKRRYNKTEFAERGDAIFESKVRPHLKAEDNGKFAAVDIESGKYEVHSDEMKACETLRERLPEAQIWLVRIGSLYAHRFGGHERRENS